LSYNSKSVPPVPKILILFYIFYLYYCILSMITSIKWATTVCSVFLVFVGHHVSAEFDGLFNLANGSGRIRGGNRQGTVWCLSRLSICSSGRVLFLTSLCLFWSRPVFQATHCGQHQPWTRTAYVSALCPKADVMLVSFSHRLGWLRFCCAKRWRNREDIRL